MKTITNILICLFIAMSTNVLSVSLVFADDKNDKKNIEVKQSTNGDKSKDVVINGAEVLTTGPYSKDENQ